VPVAASTAVTLDDTAKQLPPGERAAQVDALTGLRGFAALMVVFVHAAGRTDFPGFGVQGYGPVSLFVLSGFLLFQPWSRWAMDDGRRPSVRRFARRRLARIFPAYLVVMLAVAVMYPASQPNGLDGWARALTLTGTTASDGLRPGLEQTWSLGTELSWDVLVPVVGLLVGLTARRLSGVRGFWAGAILMLLAVPVTAFWRWWIHVEGLEKNFTYSFWLPGFLVCFAGGALVSHLLEGERVGLIRLDRLREWAADPWLLVAFALAVTAIGSSSLGGPTLYLPSTFTERQVRFVCSTVLALTLLLAAAMASRTSPVARLLSSRWLVATGRWSYGIYLWHLPVIALLENDFTHRTGVDGFALWIGCVLVAAIPLGAATYVWVENPAIAWSRRLPGNRS
jgi:peptidoglycan/LPS O-acetylase OafA/YrhL